MRLVGILCAAAIFGMTWARQNFQTTEKAPTAILQAAEVPQLRLVAAQPGRFAGVVAANTLAQVRDVDAAYPAVGVAPGQLRQPLPHDIVDDPVGVCGIGGL